MNVCEGKKQAWRLLVARRQKNSLHEKPKKKKKRGSGGIQIDANPAHMLGCVCVCGFLPHRVVSTWHPSPATSTSFLWWRSPPRGSPSRIACKHTHESWPHASAKTCTHKHTHTHSLTEANFHWHTPVHGRAHACTQCELIHTEQGWRNTGVWGWRVVKTNTVGGLISLKWPQKIKQKRQKQRPLTDDGTIQDEICLPWCNPVDQWIMEAHHRHFLRESAYHMYSVGRRVTGDRQDRQAGPKICW